MIKITTDSTCDLPAWVLEQHHISVTPLGVVKGGRLYQDGVDIRTADIKAHVDAGGDITTTNAVNVGQAAEVLEPILQEGRDVLVLAFSSGLSTTYNSFKIAGDELAAQFPDRKVFVVDTLSASLGQGMLVAQAAQLRLDGKTIEEVRDWTEQNKLRQCHWFTVNDLFFLKKGGRVSAATALVGSMLQIKPVMHMDDEGHLINVSKARGRKASLLALADKVGELAEDPASQTMYISNSACLEDAQFVADEVKRRYGVKEIIINSIGPVIGAHTGPGCVALFFMGKHR